ncbi:TPA: hypothetical protein DDW69_03520 [candidate division CPR2 bacterium]|uniref:Beta-lactamase domain protein n=1 Tax=candidate division CPR2 bacterium GW2011_GWC1_41_48 TaxID=1618344 RepID=A0A0G0WAD7_UNCC2|nr:MAG: Beta-lactamase domain protein [candidate division CPR2 bacterium GW2011_GWC2_39_35]KKR27783.1 MAG: Beta-lactamase domain protein [candidate division CPR2 bacterium GW2011_GWD1_39_7]KKR28800.1 MAG: Beta-lactamase domain protein [candidate division CPR2 bacterium GW2011_GWD2_39_7]KKS09042.1 MAG: Beta-lactamase domain protein [candidate division CPR2 bacterium GW2011_GWC1_41_48]OGB59801.1 MAG: hypothetical protein A2Y27_00045 [candidate division CPR2 bacterium GWD1_39_7]OGB73160.1 MAG: hy
MKITLLGTGSFIADLKHGGPGYLLEINDKKILIDAGSGVQQKLLQLDVNPDDLDAIYITHQHADHATDLFAIIFRRFINYLSDKKEPKKELFVYGPRDTQKLIDDLGKVFKLESMSGWKWVQGIDLDGEKDFDDFTVEAFQVEHLNVVSNIYRFEAEGKAIVFSGDTPKNKGIEDATKNVDIAIMDASNSKDSVPDKVHTNTFEIAEICQNSCVKKIVLSHFRSINYDKDLVAEVKEGFDGEVILGEDMMEIEL